IPHERDLLSLRIEGDLFEGLASDKFVIEFDERPVAEIVWRQIIVSDIARVEAASERRHGFVAFAAQPLSVAPQLLIDIDSRKRRRNPPGFETGGRVSP